MNSKLELRNEAVRLAVNVEGVNAENLVEVARKIEAYILEDSELPELYDIAEKTMEMMEKVVSNYKPDAEIIEKLKLNNEEAKS